jgi:hypothetical protein
VWHFTEIDNDSRVITDPTALTVQSHGDLSQLQIFVREVLQNSLDNRAGTQAVRVDFRLKYVQGDLKTRFLEAIGFSQILPHMNAVIADQKKRKRSTDFPEPQALNRKRLHSKASIYRRLQHTGFDHAGI